MAPRSQDQRERRERPSSAYVVFSGDETLAPVAMFTNWEAARNLEQSIMVGPESLIEDAHYYPSIENAKANDPAVLPTGREQFQVVFAERESHCEASLFADIDAASEWRSRLQLRSDVIFAGKCDFHICDSCERAMKRLSERRRPPISAEKRASDFISNIR